MKVEVILVPKGKCPLNILSEMKDRIKNSWFFFHENAYEYLLKSNGVTHSSPNRMNVNQSTLFKWETTEKYPQAILLCEIPNPNGWGLVTSIEAENITYYNYPFNPEEIFFIKME